ncbi:MAG TPA: peptide deformylase [Syntrophorhabdaceae bacterium]|nr:peptide deformylase [Syntrophorhabdaceae bacterium]HOL06280.1 peptide deformylase [Syntrophorhabdaceae bacterium]HPP41822.1 peptide deformylase [Syntrophorhabdaceae bacterium]
MALLEIRVYPDRVLRETAKPIDEITDEIIRLSQDMIETMRLARGAGLAANQVGIPIRLIVVELKSGKVGKPVAIINPEIISSESEEISEEGCLSVPGYYEYINRPKKVSVKGVTIDNAPFQIECEGHLARAFQHEIDHLNGRLFIDYLSPVKKNIFKKRYLKQKNR